MEIFKINAPVVIFILHFLEKKNSFAAYHNYIFYTTIIMVKHLENLESINK